MRYLTADDVAAVNERLLGPDRLRDFGLLDSAVHRPQAAFGGEDAYPDVHSKAAALFHSLTRNHPFLDGNKRTAVVAVVMFYGLNGYRLEAEQGEMVALAVDVAEGLLDVAAIAGVLKGRASEWMLFDPDDAIEVEVEDDS